MLLPDGVKDIINLLYSNFSLLLPTRVRPLQVSCLDRSSDIHRSSVLPEWHRHQHPSHLLRSPSAQTHTLIVPGGDHYQYPVHNTLMLKLLKSCTKTRIPSISKTILASSQLLERRTWPCAAQALPYLHHRLMIFHTASERS